MHNEVYVNYSVKHSFIFRMCLKVNRNSLSCLKSSLGLALASFFWPEPN